MRASEGDLCPSAFSMYRNDDLTFAPLFMLVLIKTAAVLSQPFPKCGTFHCFVPMYQDLDRVEPLWLSFTRNFGIMQKFSNASVDLRQTAE